MIHFLKLNMVRVCSVVVLLAFISTSVVPPSYAQMVKMPEPGTLVGLTPAFTPAHLMGLTIDPKNALKFDFLMHKGDTALTAAEKKAEYTNLIKYFLASLATPNNDQWVNLSPYEGNRIIKDDFGVTEMGRDLLAQDYMLKQLTASLMHPDTELGKKFWAQVYEKAYQQYGSTDIPVDTFNKIWITADDASVYEKNNTAIIVNSHLKIRTERDYMATGNNVVSREGAAAPAMPESARISAEIVKEIIIPAIEKEVNEGTTFANLRQIYSSMILAVWFKQQLKESILGKAYADRSKTKGLEQDPKNNEAIYQQYLASFKKGVFNMIKEDVDRYTNEAIPRKYFSGGANCAQVTVDHSEKAKSTAEDAVRSAAGASELDDLKVAFAEPAGESTDRSQMSVKEMKSWVQDYLRIIGNSVDVSSFRRVVREMKTNSPEDFRKRVQAEVFVPLLRMAKVSADDHMKESLARGFHELEQILKTPKAAQMTTEEVKSLVLDYLKIASNSMDLSVYKAAVKEERSRNPGSLRPWVQAEVIDPILKSLEPIDELARFNIVMMIEELKRRLKASDASENTNNASLAAQERVKVGERYARMNSLARGLKIPQGAKTGGIRRIYDKAYYSLYRFKTAKRMLEEAQRAFSEIKDYQMAAAFAGMRVPSELMDARDLFGRFLESRTAGNAFKENTAFKDMVAAYTELTGLMEKIYENSDPNSRLTVKTVVDAAMNEEQREALTMDLVRYREQLLALQRQLTIEYSPELEKKVIEAARKHNEIVSKVGDPFSPINIEMELGFSDLSSESRSVADITGKIKEVQDFYQTDHRIQPVLAKVVTLISASKFEEAWSELKNAEQMALDAYNIYGLHRTKTPPSMAKALQLIQDGQADELWRLLKAYEAPLVLYYKPVSTLQRVSIELARKSEELGTRSLSAQDERAIIMEAADIEKRYGGESDRYDPYDIVDLERQIQHEYTSTGERLTPAVRAHIKRVMSKLDVVWRKPQLKEGVELTAGMKAELEAPKSERDRILFDVVARVKNALVMDDNRWHAYTHVEMGWTPRLEEPGLILDVARLGLAGNERKVSEEQLTERLKTLFGDKVTLFMLGFVDVSRSHILMNSAGVAATFTDIELGEGFSAAGSAKSFSRTVQEMIQKAKVEAGQALAKKDFKGAMAIANQLGRELVKVETNQKGIDEVLSLVSLIKGLEAEAAAAKDKNNSAAQATLQDVQAAFSMDGLIDVITRLPIGLFQDEQVKEAIVQKAARLSSRGVLPELQEGLSDLMYNVAARVEEVGEVESLGVDAYADLDIFEGLRDWVDNVQEIPALGTVLDNDYKINRDNLRDLLNLVIGKAQERRDKKDLRILYLQGKKPLQPEDVQPGDYISLTTGGRLVIGEVSENSNGVIQFYQDELSENDWRVPYNAIKPGSMRAHVAGFKPLEFSAVRKGTTVSFSTISGTEVKGVVIRASAKELLIGGNVYQKADIDPITLERYANSAKLPGDVKKVGYGGIDFNEQYLKMNIKRDGNGVPLPVGQQDLDNIKINGLVPVIMSVTPVTALPTLN